MWQTCCGRADCAAVVLPRQRHKGRCACLCQPVALQMGMGLLERGALSIPQRCSDLGALLRHSVHRCHKGHARCEVTEL